ncbi:MAG: hypothetical protein GC178_18140 [Flavobacteriales bacterium]|nr:hypothetical protein [Flavobacteriales bacterium]
MKHAIIIFIIVLVLTAIGVPTYLILCRTPHRPIYRASYLIDRTDTFGLEPISIVTENSFSWDKLKEGRNIRIRKVSDVVNEDVSILTLETYRDWSNPSTWNFEDNELFRENRIRKFEEELTTTLNAIAIQRTGYGHTAVMEPLIQELLYLQQYPMDDRELFVYSDLGQNTPQDNWISHSVNHKGLEIDSPHLWTGIDGAYDLTDLSGIHVHLIHRPRNAEDDAEYRLRANYAKNRLTELGAEVYIHGAINHSGY